MLADLFCAHRAQTDIHQPGHHEQDGESVAQKGDLEHFDAGRQIAADRD